MSGDLVGQIEHFFISYNKAKGKAFEPKGRSGRERALALARHSLIGTWAFRSKEIVH